MKAAPQAEPLSPAECRELRFFLNRSRKVKVVEEHLEPAEVARRLALGKRTILDLVRDGAFPNAVKLFHTKIRIPASDVAAFLAKRRVHGGVQASVPRDSEVSHG